MAVKAKRINQVEWQRQALYEFFSEGADSQLYEITSMLDVARLYQFTKQNKISFYYALIYLSTQTFNEIENFRYKIRDEEVYLLDYLVPSFTDLKPGSELFQIITVGPTAETDIIQFSQKAKLTSQHQTEFFDVSLDYAEDDLIQFSCLPWLHYSSLNMERSQNLNDSIIKATWGKYEKAGTHYTLPYTVQVNHRLVDGIHLGQFFKQLQQKIEQLPLKTML